MESSDEKNKSTLGNEGKKSADVAARRLACNENLHNQTQEAQTKVDFIDISSLEPSMQPSKAESDHSQPASSPSAIIGNQVRSLISVDANPYKEQYMYIM